MAYGRIENLLHNTTHWTDVFTFRLNSMELSRDCLSHKYQLLAVTVCPALH